MDQRPPPIARAAHLAVAAGQHLRREWSGVPGCLGLLAVFAGVYGVLGLIGWALWETFS